MASRSLKTLVLVFMAALFALGSLAEAAPRKSVKTRVKHSSRVSTSATAPAKKKAAPKERVKKGGKRTSASTIQKATTKPR